MPMQRSSRGRVLAKQTSRIPVSVASVLKKYNVTVPGGIEALFWVYYDYLTYPQAGQAGPFSFFTRGPAGLTPSDTNMPNSGNVGGQKMFLALGLEMEFIPGSAAGLFGAEQAPKRLNDMNLVVNALSSTVFQIIDKPYWQDGPLTKFPPRGHLRSTGFAADQSTIAGNLQTLADAPFVDGERTKFSGQLIDSVTEFSVVTTFKGGAPAISTAGTLGARLIGVLLRPAQ